MAARLINLINWYVGGKDLYDFNINRISIFKWLKSSGFIKDTEKLSEPF